MATKQTPLGIIEFTEKEDGTLNFRQGFSPSMITISRRKLMSDALRQVADQLDLGKTEDADGYVVRKWKVE